ncbi:hypothetical protein ANCCEY_07271 [Ancylostoma ceylanicum]|uniref:Dipeptidylpeptidase IV N-terminal domain-containing protein n=1 Tax=Ancylostoma ceylanicum TaxID=53326 RepID=A0A0D6LNF0_9BILA|nr:hypothetical protein ANCCEY_07271 [Ancylostoma ceylanicum]
MNHTDLQNLVTEVYEHKYPSKMWAEPSDFVSLLGTDDGIYMLLPRATADGNSYQHIAKLMIQMDSSKTAKGVKWAKSSFLSLGNFDVTDIESYDKTTDTLYFTALAPSPTNRHLYLTKGSPTTSDAWSCLTCKFSNCTFQSNQISSDFKHIITWCKRWHLVVEILRDEEYEERLAATMLPFVISEAFPLKQGYGKLAKLANT